MQIAKWGNSLAVRLPARMVQELGLKAGDEIEDVQGAVSLLTLMMKFVDAQASGKDDEAGR